MDMDIHPCVFSESAAPTSSYLALNGDEHVLDVATGTGFVALSVVKHVPFGHVTGIDFSSGLLELAVKNQGAQGIDNVSFIEMDRLKTDKGIWLEMSILYTVVKKTEDQGNS